MKCAEYSALGSSFYQKLFFNRTEYNLDSISVLVAWNNSWTAIARSAEPQWKHVNMLSAVAGLAGRATELSATLVLNVPGKVTLRDTLN